MLVTEQNVILKSYDFDTPVQTMGSKFTLKRGVRMNAHDQNWILFTDYMSLSFSFMTFVIKDSLTDQNLPRNGNLDIEAYNYNINRKTFLTCNNFVAMYSNSLKKILTFLE